MALEPQGARCSPPTLFRLWTWQVATDANGRVSVREREIVLESILPIHARTTTIMAAPRYCPSCLTKASPTTLFRTARAVAPPPFLRPFHTSSPFAAVLSANAAKYRRKDGPIVSKRRKRSSPNFATPDLRDALQFSLVDAMRYVEPQINPPKTLPTQY